MSQSKTFPLGRDSKTGEFIPVKEAQRRPNTTTVERIPKAGIKNSIKMQRNISNLFFHFILFGLINKKCNYPMNVSKK